MTKPILVWDIPTRLFHLLFSASVLAALAIAMSTEPESPLFRVHMLLGLLAASFVLLRLVWGLVGSRYARFRSFIFGPRALSQYLLGVLRRNAKRYLGHNPGSSYAIFAMLLLTLGLATTGMLMSSAEALEELHKLFGLLMLLVVLGHILGVILHITRHHENIVSSMLHGKKAGEEKDGISSAHPLVGALFFSLALASIALLFNAYDDKTGELSILGQSLRLGEDEGEEHEHEGEEHEAKEHEHEGEEHD